MPIPRVLVQRADEINESNLASAVLVELVTCELSALAISAYCDHLRQQFEQGHDPAVPTNWRFLRGVRVHP